MAKHPDSDTRNTQLAEQHEPAKNTEGDRGRGPATAQNRGAVGVQKVTQDPSVERGERIDTGKAIGRGGKTTGDVAGATEQPPKQ